MVGKEIFQGMAGSDLECKLGIIFIPQQGSSQTGPLIMALSSGGSGQAQSADIKAKAAQREDSHPSHLLFVDGCGDEE